MTLADIVVSWKEGDRVRTAPGRQIAHLLTAAAAYCPSDQSFGLEADNTGQWIYKLRGLACVISPGAGFSVHESDARAMISDLLEIAAAEIAADELDTADWPARFSVRATPERPRKDKEGCPS